MYTFMSKFRASKVRHNIYLCIGWHYPVSRVIDNVTSKRFWEFFYLARWLVPSIYIFRVVINLIFEIMIIQLLDFIELDIWC